MKFNLNYIDAIPEDSELLSATAFDSKRMWGYSDDLMDLWKSDLEISREYISENNVVKVFEEHLFLGFFATKVIDTENAELDHLWLKPENIRKHYGREIFRYIIHDLSLNGFKKMTLIAEPNATGFYQKMEGKVIGKFQSKISGRFLDIYEFRTNNTINHQQHI